MSSLFKHSYLLLLMIMFYPHARAEAGKGVIIFQADFESSQADWNEEKYNMCSIRSASGYSNGNGLNVSDTSEKYGSEYYSKKIPVKVKKEYQISFYAKINSGSGISIYINFYDTKNSLVNNDPSRAIGIQNRNIWTAYTKKIIAPVNAVYALIWVHSYNQNMVDADIDNLTVTENEIDDALPWTPEYKIRPEEKHKLTASDVIGPDGVIYPNWTYAGVEKGIPVVQVKARLEAPQIKEGDDITALIREKIFFLAQNSGGALFIGSGNYLISDLIIIPHNKIVIRGAGMDKTRLLFDYRISRGKPVFYGLENNSQAGPNMVIAIHAFWQDLVYLSLEADGKILKEDDKSKNERSWKKKFSLERHVDLVLNEIGAGRHTFTARVKYANSDEFTETVNLELVYTNTGGHKTGFIQYPAVFYFSGQNHRFSTVTNFLTQDAGRGEMHITIEKKHNYKTGDKFIIEAPATERWNTLVKNSCTRWGTYRQNMYEIATVQNNVLYLKQPLRISFPVIDGSFLRLVEPVENCGVEDITLEHRSDFFISSVVFAQAWNCWMRKVRVYNTGRLPVQVYISKHCEIRDCIFDSAQYNYGETAYIGGNRAYDCLFDGISSYKMRHAPNNNWACAGNVFRNSRYEDSDGQWHCGWPHENLYENLVIMSKTNYGGYGFGLYSTPPEDNEHGPCGPRNAVYNCDISSIKDGLMLNGMNENWLIMYNRFIVENGRAIIARCSSFDHIIKGNVFCLKNCPDFAVFIKDPTCRGIEISDNKIYASTPAIVGGSAEPEKNINNTIEKYSLADRPEVKVPSIYEWQNINIGRCMVQKRDK
ncbi:MAG: hypothetical protein A2096_02595 [Spirochaetes bacterium GWF1_41_5]|nr:MAG: hypothetical protein A2096_02595 [Spirochaetes bacterium GWF1_41_5]HBE00848.1 hypothetical protein [Spirochaetia bacterium]